MFKIVYVTVGADKIEYINMQRIAVASAKKHMPHIPVVIVTDGETLPKLRKYKDFSGVELASFPVPADLNTVEKSRYLKTNLRSLISGDFLYIDSDSIICEDFSDDLPECSLGLVLDENRPLAEQDDGGAAIRRCAQARGFDLSGCESYFNGGVIFAKDDAPAKAFFKDWYANWDRTRSEGNHHDQYSLNAVEMKRRLITELDGAWNCQLTSCCASFSYLRNVKILHYLSVQPDGIYQLNNADLMCGELSDARIAQIIDRPELLFNRFHMYADSSVEYRLTNTSHYHFINRMFTKHPKLFRFGEKLLSIFRA